MVREHPRVVVVAVGPVAVAVPVPVPVEVVRPASQSHVSLADLDVLWERVRGR